MPHSRLVSSASSEDKTQKRRCNIYRPIYYASDDEEEENPIDELEQLEAEAAGATPEQMTTALARIAAVFDANDIIYATIGGFNFWNRGSDRRTEDIDIAVHRTPSVATILDYFNDDPLMTRPERAMQWVSGTARIFVNINNQQVQIDLLRQAGDSYGAAIDLRSAVERLPLRGMPDVSVNFITVRYLMHTKLRAFMGRSAEKDFEDLTFACTDKTMAPKVRQVADSFDLSWRRSFLSAYLEENDASATADSIRWAFRLEHESVETLPAQDSD